MRYLLALLAVSLSLQVAVAAEKDLSADALVGDWSVAEQLPNGTEVTSRMTLERGMKFSGSVAAGGNVIWEYSGSWALVGRTLTWNYEKSSRPLPDAAKVDVDQVVSVGPTRLVLISQQSGKQHEFRRTP